MSAQDNLNPAQFYHGSPAHYKVGDLVTPGHAPEWEQSDPSKVYFTDQPKSALRWGANNIPAKVYAVEPTGDYTTDSHFPERDPEPDEMLPAGKRRFAAGEAGQGATSWESKSPLRVTGVHPDYAKSRWGY